MQCTTGALETAQTLSVEWRTLLTLNGRHLFDIANFSTLTWVCDDLVAPTMMRVLTLAC